MHHLVYSSTASIGLTEAEMQRQLGHWRSTNVSLNITGLLLFSTEGNIMQVLEGDATVVHQLYTVIAADIRHRNLVKLADGPVPSRAFADWLMQFRRVAPADFSRLTLRPDATPEHIRNLVPLLEAFMAEEPPRGV
ncbi:BLUF domain-containing protein [Hymenobacter siberiensis]|uniref:BLUF domain-containing protein n=1 Tax=Hymenobacter siberiensis TaxID=2848396 RepID=UPI001C1E349A|nr:BLUF domain-containing protein [Hymenobacter siberiensis]